MRSLATKSPLYHFPTQSFFVSLLVVVLAFVSNYKHGGLSIPVIRSITAFSTLCLITPWLARYVYITFLRLEHVVDAITESNQHELFSKYENLAFGLNRWSVLVTLALIFFAAITNISIWGLNWGSDSITLGILLSLLFGMFGNLGWAYGSIILFLFKFKTLELDFEPFETKKNEFDKLSSIFLGICIAGVVLYISTIVAGWLSIGPYLLLIPVLRFWIYPLAIMVIAFFVAVQISLHDIMKKAKDIRINKIMLLVQKFYREWEQTQLREKSASINDLLSWREKVEKESDVPFDFITILSLLVTIVLPLVKSIIDLFR